jgi:hypothetical protein
MNAAVIKGEGLGETKELEGWKVGIKRLKGWKVAIGMLEGWKV